MLVMQQPAVKLLDFPWVPWYNKPALGFYLETAVGPYLDQLEG